MSGGGNKERIVESFKTRNSSNPSKIISNFTTSLDELKKKQNNLSNKLTIVDKKFRNKFDEIKTGVKTLFNTFINFNRMQIDDTYSSVVKVLFDDNILRTNAKTIKNGIKNAYKEPSSSDKNISILNFIFFNYTGKTSKGLDKSEVTTYVKYIYTLNHEIKDYFEHPFTMEDDERSNLSKQGDDIMKRTEDSVLKSIINFRNKYLSHTKDKEGKDKVDFKKFEELCEQWKTIYSDTKYYNNEDMENYMKRRVVALVDIMGIETEEDDAYDEDEDDDYDS
jgi:hypothetical protein